MKIFRAVNRLRRDEKRQIHPAPAVIWCVAVLLACGVAVSWFFPWDRSVSHWLVSYGEDGIGHLLTDAADLAGNGFYQCLIPVAVGGVAWRMGNRELFSRMAVVIASVALSGLLVNIVKFVVGRARPSQGLSDWFTSPLSTESGFHSFPSGHTTTSFAMAYVLSSFYPRLAPLWYVTAFLIGFGRVMGESHFPTDTFAGAILGVVTGWALIHFRLAHWLEKRLSFIREKS